MNFVSFAEAIARIGKGIPPPDWYIDRGLPSTAVEMRTVWAADGLLRKYRDASAAALLYAAIREKGAQLDVYDNTLGTPVYSQESVTFIEERARAMHQNCAACLEAVRHQQEFGVSLSRPSWWSAHHPDDTTYGFDETQLVQKFGYIALKETPALHNEQEPETTVSDESAEPAGLSPKAASNENVQLPSSLQSAPDRSIEHCIQGAKNMQELARSIIKEVLREDPRLMEPVKHQVANIQSAFWLKLHEIAKLPENKRPVFLLEEVHGNHAKKIEGYFEYLKYSEVKSYKLEACRSEIRRYLEILATKPDA